MGLAFELTADRDKPDVEGVIWIDEESAELRYVEFGYTDPPWEVTMPWTTESPRPVLRPPDFVV